MLALGAQAAIAALHLLFGVLALGVTRSLPASERVFRYGWALTAAMFCLRGVNASLHAIYNIVAFRSGPGSWMWETAGLVHPVMNHSRTFLLTAYCLVLGVVLVRARRERPLPAPSIAFSLLLAGMAAGAYVGWNEEAFSALTHYTAVAVLDIMELLALMGLLFLGLTTSAMDRSLWAALGVNAFVLALSVLWFAALSRIDMAGQWSPRPSHVHLSKSILYLAMIAIAARQLMRLRAGKRVRSILGADPRRAVPSLHG
ncbi:MAG TPA: hypothetical protein VLK84_03875 [Longimicrobium sp.]|nr:hypothetical protein [Longimicrobium sp.]